MSQLTTTTRRRLQNLPQIASVWEGDQRTLSAGLKAGVSPLDAQEGGSCILWVDRSQAIVRAIDIVPEHSGIEATVRTLLQAMESPHDANHTRPARPQKIVVRDRQLQFYLRGVLQDLDIKVEFQADLPFIDEIYQSIAEMIARRGPSLPEAYAETLETKAMSIWNDAPWTYLADHQIIEVTIDHWDVGPLYTSVMGMLGMEFGVLLYRSLESLKQFRQQVLDEDKENIEGAFFNQDCFYITFGPLDPDDEAWEGPTAPSFGLIHPLEGFRTHLHEEEVVVLIVALEALHRFFQQHQTQLDTSFTKKTSRYRIPNPQTSSHEHRPTISATVKTLPTIAAEFEEEFEDDIGLTDSQDLQGPDVILNDDLIPEGAFLQLTTLPWETLELLKQQGRYFDLTPADLNNPELTQASNGLPVLIVQTSRPKAKTLISTLQQSGNPLYFCFNLRFDPVTGHHSYLQILQTGNGDLHLIDDVPEKTVQHHWEEHCQSTRGVCGLVVAMGVTAKHREIQLRHMLAIYSMQLVAPEAMGLGPLVMPKFSFYAE